MNPWKNKKMNPWKLRRRSVVQQPFVQDPNEDKIDIKLNDDNDEKSDSVSVDVDEGESKEPETVEPQVIVKPNIINNMDKKPPKKSLKDIIDEKIKYYTKNNTLKSLAIYELKDSYPILKSIEHKKDITTVYDPSNDDKCKNFKETSVSSGAIKSEPDIMHILDNCNDDTFKNIVSESASKYSFFK